MADKLNCLFCKKKLKNNSNKRVHRSCWLKERDFEDRYLDFLFCNERKRKAPSKSFIIKPIRDEKEKDHVEEAIEYINQMIMDNRPSNYEEDSGVRYVIDIAGNEVEI